MLKTLRLTIEAKKDLKAIGRYSYQNFGQQQMEQYLAKIDTGLSLISREPEIGKQRDDIKIGYRSYTVEKHLIFYRIVDQYIDILGITSGSMDLKTHYSRFIGTL